LPFSGQIPRDLATFKKFKNVVWAHLQQTEALRRAHCAPACRFWCAAAVARFCFRFFLLHFLLLFARAFSNLCPPLPRALTLARKLQRASVRPSFRPLCASLSPQLFRAPRLRAKFLLTNSLSLLPSAFERSSCSAPLAAFGAPMTAPIAVPRFCGKRLRAQHVQRCVAT